MVTGSDVWTVAVDMISKNKGILFLIALFVAAFIWKRYRDKKKGKVKEPLFETRPQTAVKEETFSETFTDDYLLVGEESAIKGISNVEKAMSEERNDFESRMQKDFVKLQKELVEVNKKKAETKNYGIELSKYYVKLR